MYGSLVIDYEIANEWTKDERSFAFKIIKNLPRNALLELMDIFRFIFVDKDDSIDNIDKDELAATIFGDVRKDQALPLLVSFAQKYHIA